MSRTTYIAVAALIALAAIPIPALAGAQQTIKIGFFGPLTGPVAADGTSARQAVELALKEVNAAGGRLRKGLKQIADILRAEKKNILEVRSGRLKK